MSITGLDMYAPLRWEVLAKHLGTAQGLAKWDFRGRGRLKNTYYFRHQDTGDLLILNDDGTVVNQDEATLKACKRAGI